MDKEGVDSFQFFIVTPNRNYHLMAPSPAEARAWVDAILLQVSEQSGESSVAQREQNITRWTVCLVTNSACPYSRRCVR